MKALQDLEIFVRTAESSNLSATARGLHLTPAAASAALKRLELELGVQLFVRSTRSLRLTQAGLFFLDKCRPALTSLHDARQHLALGQPQLGGLLQLAAPSDLGRNLLLPWLDSFQSLHPQVRIQLHLSDRLANIYIEPIDAAFRYGRPRDSSLVALPVAPDNQRILCASPIYIEKFGQPQHPSELMEHRCLCFMIGQDMHAKWKFFHVDNRSPITVNVNAFNASNDGDVVRHWAIEGGGIAYKSYLDVAWDLAQGRLQVLCPEWQTEISPLYLTVPNRHQVTPLLRTLQKYVIEQLEKIPSMAPADLR